MSAFGPEQSRRYVVPPLWLVPLLLIAAVFALYLSAGISGGLGPVALLVFLARVQPRIDAYVRRREAAADD